jgi:hypothetical protein
MNGNFIKGYFESGKLREDTFGLENKRPINKFIIMAFTTIPYVTGLSDEGKRRKRNERED